MDVILLNTDLAHVEADALAVIVFERAEGASIIAGESAAAADAACGGWIAEILAGGEFSGKLLEQTVLGAPRGIEGEAAGGRGRRQGGEIHIHRNAQGVSGRVARLEAEEVFHSRIGL